MNELITNLKKNVQFYYLFLLFNTSLILEAFS